MCIICVILTRSASEEAQKSLQKSKAPFQRMQGYLTLADALTCMIMRGEPTESEDLHTAIAASEFISFSTVFPALLTVLYQ